MVAKSLRWTTRDLAAMPDDGGWKRYEIVDGELFVTQSTTHSPPECSWQVAGSFRTLV